MGEILPTPNPEEIDFSGNKKRFHEVFGGRKPRWFPRSYYTREAYETRDVLIKIAIEARKEKKPGTLGEIGKDVCITQTQLSRAAAGLLSNKPMDLYNGLSPRDFVLDTLENYYQEKYSPKPEYYI